MKSPWQVNKTHSKGNSANIWAKWVLRRGGNFVSLPFIWLGVSPNFVTWFSLGSGFLGALFVALGHFIPGILFLFFAQLLDYADGTVARVLDRRSGWGRFLDSQFGKYINAATWIAIIYVFLAHDLDMAFPAEFVVLVAILVPLVQSMTQSVKLQKKNYEGRIKDALGVESVASTALQNEKESGVVKNLSSPNALGLKKKIEKIILYVLGLWQGVNFPLFALFLLAGLLEFYVLVAFFFAMYAFAYAWLKAFMTNAILKANPL